VRPPVRTEVDGVGVTVSVGVALLGRHGRSYAELMNAADNALYDAKRDGKDCWRMSGPRPSVPGDDIPRPRRHLTDLSGASRIER
jgi:hypothetical protein